MTTTRRLRRPSHRELTRSLWPLVVVAWALVASASAQRASLAVVTGDAGSSLLARIGAVRDGAGSVDAWARVGADVGFGVTWRYAEVFGALGNVIVEGGPEVLIAGGPGPSGARASLGARGVIGPVAAAFRVDGGTVSEDDLDGALRAEAVRPAAGAGAGAWDVGGRLSLTYRLDRATALTLEPRARWIDGVTATFVSATVRRSGAWNELDVFLGLEGGTLLGARAAAIGVGTIWTRRREPDSWLRLWFGSDGARLLPGVEALLASRAPGVSLALGAAWVPHRLDAHAWRVTFDVGGASPMADDRAWRLRSAIAGGPDGSARFSLSLAVERPWALSR